MKELSFDKFKIGTFEDMENMTGVSVIMAEEGATVGVDVRGLAPGTRETDLIKSEKKVDKAHAVVLAGGSAFGLSASSGVMRYLSERGYGFDVGVARVPIVPSAVIFDLSCGNPKAYPDESMGYRACENASGTVEEGSFGAGCGATVGKMRGFEFSMKSGVGYHEIEHISGVKVGAYICVNACGEVYDEKLSGSDMEICAGNLNDGMNKIIPADEIISCGQNMAQSGTNTTIGCVMTNACLSKVQCNRVASMAHDGLAKSIRPVHTSMDGDTIFALSSGELKAEEAGMEISDLVGYLAVEAVRQAVISAVKSAKINGL